MIVNLRISLLICLVISGISNSIYGCVTSINDPYVMSAEEYKTLCRLKRTLSHTVFDQHEINLVLFNAAGCGYQMVVNTLINLPISCQTRPDQQGINWAFSEAIRNDYRQMIIMFIDRQENQLKPDQFGINQALCKATRNENHSLIEFLLNRSAGQLQPDQQGMHCALSIAALYGRKDQLEWFLNLPIGKLRPNQEDVNRALSLSSSAGFPLIVGWLLCRNTDQLRPDQDGIITAYKQAIKFKRKAVVTILKPLVKINDAVNPKDIVSEILNK